MSRLEKARQRLQEVYRKTFYRKIETLQALARKLEVSDPRAEKELRRLAHQLHGSGASYGFDEISEHAIALEQAQPSELGSILNKLIETLQRLAPPSQSKDLVELKLLVVEDDPDQIVMLQDIFALHDPHWEVLAVTSIQEAETLVANKPIDAIILDLILTEEDGRDFLKWLRENPATSTIPVAILTILSGIETQRECIGLGADLFFKKPPHLELLAFALTGVVERRLALLRKGQTDALTGLLNREAFIKEFERQFYLAGRAGLNLSVAFIDIDRFKLTNDIYGHSQGDQMLIRLGSLLQSTLRRLDVIARWGGEEFVVLLPNTDPVGAQAALSAVKYALAQGNSGNWDNNFLNQQQPFTFSAGITQVRGQDSLDEVIARADALMYEAKKAGRDRIHVEGIEYAVPSPRLLVVEDDGDMARYTCHILREAGFSVDMRRDGKSALELAKLQKFDLIILDAMLPELTGFVLLERLREIPVYKQTPIIMLTVLSEIDNLEEAFQQGADDYVTKPFKEREFLARIKRLLRLPKN